MSQIVLAAVVLQPGNSAMAVLQLKADSGEVLYVVPWVVISDTESVAAVPAEKATSYEGVLVKKVVSTPDLLKKVRTTISGDGDYIAGVTQLLVQSGVLPNA